MKKSKKKAFAHKTLRKKDTVQPLAPELAQLSQTIFSVAPDLTQSKEELTDHLKDCYLNADQIFADVIAFKESDRDYTRELLDMMVITHLKDKEGTITKIDYPPAHYALAIMNLEDGKFEEAAFLLEQTSAQCKDELLHRNSYIQSMYSHALIRAHLKHFTVSSALLTTLYAKLPDLLGSEKDLPLKLEWEHRIQKEITGIVHRIEVPWRRIPALILSLNSNDRNLGPGVLHTLLTEVMTKDDVKEHGKDIGATVILIQKLALKNHVPHAQAILAYLHLGQRDKKMSVFNNQPIDTQKELEFAYQYACDASHDPFCKIGKDLRGEAAFRLAHYLEKNNPNNDPTIRAQITNLYKDATDFRYPSAKAYYAQNQLENPSISAKQEATQYLEDMQEASEKGLLPFQNRLAQAFFFGNTFGCGFTIEQNFIEACKHAQKNPSTLEMRIIHASLQAVGIPSSRSKPGKIAWYINPDEKKGRKILDLTVMLNEERFYSLVHSFFTHSKTPQSVKDFLFQFVGDKAATTDPSPFAVRELAYMFLHRDNTLEGIDLLERLSTYYNAPIGYLELCNIFTHGEGQVTPDFNRATKYCIQALRFFDEKTLLSEDGQVTRDQVFDLLFTLKKDEYKDDKKTQFCINLIRNACKQYGIELRDPDAALTAVDSAVSN